MSEKLRKGAANVISEANVCYAKDAEWSDFMIDDESRRSPNVVTAGARSKIARFGQRVMGAVKV